MVMLYDAADGNAMLNREWAFQTARFRLNFLNCILFTDEAGFTCNAIFNSHTYIWSDKNPHARQEVRFQ